MKKSIFKTTIIAVFAIALMAGIAMAEPVYITGTLFFNGTSLVHFADSNDRNSWYQAELQKTELINQQTGELLASYYLTNGKSTGTFWDYIPNYSTWDPYNAAPDNFPTDNGIGYRDINDNLAMLDAPYTYKSGFINTGVDWGNLEDFYFTIDSIDSFTFYDDGFMVTMYGWVEYGDDDVFKRTSAKYTISYINTSGDIYNTGVTIEALGGPSGDVPEVPEPGTLVLLGTGLLGAALVARRNRKMKK